MREVVMQTSEPVSTREATDKLVEILYSAYSKSNLKQVANNATQMNSEKRTQLLRLLKYFEDLFDGDLGDWVTEPVNLEPKPYSKPFSCKYYPFPIINKDTFRKEIKRLVQIGVLDPVKHIQYGTAVFIIPKKKGTVRFITDYCRINQKLVIKPYPLPIIGETMQHLKGFQLCDSIRSQHGILYYNNFAR